MRDIYHFIVVRFSRLRVWLNGDTISGKLAISIIANILTTPVIIYLTLLLLLSLGEIPFYIGSAPGLSENTIECDHGSTQASVWSKQIPRRMWIRWSDNEKEEEVNPISDNFFGASIAHDYGPVKDSAKHAVNVRYIDQLDSEHETKLTVFLKKCDRK